MKILHINNAYLDTPLYQNVYDALANEGVESFVHVVVRRRSEGKYREVKDRQNFSFSFIRGNAVSRLRFVGKIRKVVRDVIPVAERVQPVLLHAHTLLSDGGVAYQVKKRLGLPYVVAIRFTDLLFLRFLFFFRQLGRKVLLEADAIVVLTPSYQDQVLKLVRPFERAGIKKKLSVIPNGLNPWWEQHSGTPKKPSDAPLKFLFVGDITLRKNVLSTIRAAEELINQGIPCQLKLVGFREEKDSAYSKKVRKYCRGKDFIQLINRETDLERLRQLYEESDIFVMPSFGETFGLTYIEALSQGLPVIYSKNQGLHGYFEEGEIGYGVNPKDPKDIAEKIQMVKDNYEEQSRNALKNVSQFTWSKIAVDYKVLYQPQGEKSDKHKD